MFPDKNKYKMSDIAAAFSLPLQLFFQHIHYGW